MTSKPSGRSRSWLGASSRRRWVAIRASSGFPPRAPAGSVRPSSVRPARPAPVAGAPPARVPPPGSPGPGRPDPPVAARPDNRGTALPTDVRVRSGTHRPVPPAHRGRDNPQVRRARGNPQVHRARGNPPARRARGSLPAHRAPGNPLGHRVPGSRTARPRPGISPVRRPTGSPASAPDPVAGRVPARGSNQAIRASRRDGRDALRGPGCPSPTAVPNRTPNPAGTARPAAGVRARNGATRCRRPRWTAGSPTGTNRGRRRLPSLRTPPRCGPRTRRRPADRCRTGPRPDGRNRRPVTRRRIAPRPDGPVHRRPVHPRTGPRPDDRRPPGRQRRGCARVRMSRPRRRSAPNRLRHHHRTGPRRAGRLRRGPTRAPAPVRPFVRGIPGRPGAVAAAPARPGGRRSALPDRPGSPEWALIPTASAGSGRSSAPHGRRVRVRIRAA